MCCLRLEDVEMYDGIAKTVWRGMESLRL